MNTYSEEFKMEAVKKHWLMIVQAAKDLGINKNTLYCHLKQLSSFMQRR